MFGLTESPPAPAEAASVTAAEAPRYAGTYVHRDLVRYVVRWDGARLVLASGGEAEQPLTRARGETFRAPDEQELTFVFKPGEEKAPVPSPGPAHRPVRAGEKPRAGLNGHRPEADGCPRTDVRFPAGIPSNGSDSSVAHRVQWPGT